MSDERLCKNCKWWENMQPDISYLRQCLYDYEGDESARPNGVYGGIKGRFFGQLPPHFTGPDDGCVHFEHRQAEQ